MSSQKPCGETLETSTAEVPVPSGADFIDVFLDQGKYRPDLSVIQTMILRQHYVGLKPEFRFPIRALHVNVPLGLLAGEEVEPKAAFPKDRGADPTRLRARNSLRVPTAAQSVGCYLALCLALKLHV